MQFLRSVFISTITASALLAQGTPATPAEEPVSLENFVVTAHPYGRNQAELAQPTTVLTGDALALKQSASLGELLSSEAGVSSTYFGPSASRPVIRGQAGDRVKILENSVGLGDASVTSPDHAVSLDPLLTESVEIVRGPATLLYGNSAVGGVVNVLTHRIHTAPPGSLINGRAEFRYSSVNDEMAGGFLAEGGKGTVAWHVDGYRRTSDDVKIPGFAESAALRSEEAAEAAESGAEIPEEISGRIPNTAATADGGAFGLSYVGTGANLGFSFNGHNTIYGVPAGAHAHAHEDDHAGEEHAEAEEAPVRIDLRQRRLDVQGELTREFGLFSGARFKFGNSDYRHQELEGDMVGTVYTNRGYDARLEFLHKPAGPFTGAFGLQSGISRFGVVGDEAFVPANKTSNRALFVFEEARTGPITWQLGGRAEKQEITLNDGSGRKAEEDTPSFSAGAVWSIHEAWTFGASLSRTERAPSAQELFSEGPHLGTNAYEIGDEGLAHEKSLALDLSLRRRAGRVTGAVTFFVNRFDGYIYEQATGEQADNLDVYRYTQSDAELYGAEFESVIHLHEGRLHRFDLHLGADYVRGTNTDTDSPLPRITPARYKAGLSWSAGSFTASADVQRVETQDRVAANETSTNGYTLVAATASYRFVVADMTYDLFVRGTNLGDEEARAHTSFLKDVAPLPGRNVTIGLRTSF